MGGGVGILVLLTLLPLREPEEGSWFSGQLEVGGGVVVIINREIYRVC